MKKSLRILSSLAGIVFLISGIGKSVAAYEFSQILIQYKFDFFRFFAPLIIMFEIAIGLLLVLQIRLRQISLLAFCFVVALSLGYFYGYFFVNISDCGCFGHFSFLNMSPFFTLARNLMLICILLYVFLKSSHSHKAIDKSEILIVACILCTVCFVTGYTYVERNNIYNITQIDRKQINIDVNNSVLGEFLTFSKDSTYLVFAFTYSCPHCLNSIANLKEYEQLGVVDKVVGLALGDSVVGKEFAEIFKPNFIVKNYSKELLLRLTKRFPTAYYIKNDSIMMEFSGELPCAYVFEKNIQKK